MNRNILAVMICLLLGGGLMAQQKEKDKGKKEEIVIRKSGDADKKMTIVIDGDNVTINGKPLAEYKSDELVIQKRELENMMAPYAYVRPRVRVRTAPGPDMEDFDFHFDWDGEAPMARAYKFKMDAQPRAQIGIGTEKTDKGVKITDVAEGSAAAKSGLKKGDLITHFNGQPVSDPETLVKMVREKKPGDEVELTYLAAGEKKAKKMKLKLGATSDDVSDFHFNMPAMPPMPHQAPMAPMPPMPPMGLDEDIQREMQREFRNNQFYRHMEGRPQFGIRIQDTEDGKGVKVLDVDDESLAEQSGIKENDILTEIDGKPVNNTDDAREALSAVRDKPGYQVKVLRNGSPVTLEIKVPKKLKKAEL